MSVTSNPPVGTQIGEKPVSGPLKRTPQIRSIPPIVVWAAIGAAFVALAIYTAASWILGGRATPTPVGTSKVSTTDLVAAIGVEVSALIALPFMLFLLIRGCIRERRVTFDALLVIGYYLMIQWDPGINYVTPQFSFSSLLVNFGSWTTDLPGWVSPNANLMPEPTIMIGIGGPLLSVGVIMMGCAFLRKVIVKRWPG